MILDVIKEKLMEIDKQVYYGMADRSIKESLWNYIVFDRKIVRPNQNKTGFSYYFSVHIVREEYIPEGLDMQVIKKMQEIPGIKLAGTDMEYIYEVKPKTDTVVEMLSIDFVKAEKVQNNG